MDQQAQCDGALYYETQKRSEKGPDITGLVDITPDLLREMVAQAKAGQPVKMRVALWNREAKNTGQPYQYCRVQNYVPRGGQQGAGYPQQGGYPQQQGGYPPQPGYPPQGYYQPAPAQGQPHPQPVQGQPHPGGYPQQQPHPHGVQHPQQPDKAEDFDDDIPF